MTESFLMLALLLLMVAATAGGKTDPAAPVAAPMDSRLTTAYDLLRHNGVELGKRDFLGNP